MQQASPNSCRQPQPQPQPPAGWGVWAPSLPAGTCGLELPWVAGRRFCSGGSSGAVSLVIRKPRFSEGISRGPRRRSALHVLSRRGLRPPAAAGPLGARTWPCLPAASPTPRRPDFSVACSSSCHPQPAADHSALFPSCSHRSRSLSFINACWSFSKHDSAELGV